MRGGDEGERDLAERYRTDMVAFTPGPHDVRIVRGTWVVYVRAVRGTQRLLGPGIGITGAVLALVFTIALVGRPWRQQVVALAVWIAVLLAAAAWTRHRARRRPWRVGVVRGPDPGSWNPGPPTLEHEVQLERGQDPVAVVEQLADDVRAGRFDPHPDHGRG